MATNEDILGGKTNPPTNEDILLDIAKRYFEVINDVLSTKMNIIRDISKRDLKCFEYVKDQFICLGEDK